MKDLQIHFITRTVITLNSGGSPDFTTVFYVAFWNKTLLRSTQNEIHAKWLKTIFLDRHFLVGLRYHNFQVRSDQTVFLIQHIQF